MVNPFAHPLWLAGLGWLFFGREARRYRVLGWAYVVTLAAFMILHGKDYYVAPAYPMLFAAGAVVCEEWIEGTRRAWLKPAFVLVLVIPALVFLPLIAPVISPERFVAFTRAIHFTPPVSEHSHARSPLPQYYSDELGWEAMVAEVVRVYHTLPPAVQAKTAIKASAPSLPPAATHPTWPRSTKWWNSTSPASSASPPSTARTSLPFPEIGRAS